MSAKAQPIGFRAFWKNSALALAVAGVFAGGCEDKPPRTTGTKPDSSQLAVAPPDVKATTAPATQPTVVVAPAPGPLSEEILRQRIADYEKKIGALAQQPKAPATQPVGEPSMVEWAKAAGTGPIKLPEPRVVPLAKPAVDNQPSRANASARLLETGELTATPAAAIRVAPEADRSLSPLKPATPSTDLDAKLGKHLQDSPRELWAHLDYQLLKFLRDEQVPQLDALSGLPIEDRELLSVVLDGLSEFRSGLRADNNMLLSRKIKPLLDLVDRLRSQADLNIPTMALCTQIDTFGVYTPIEPQRFLAGKDHEVLLYCEVENFASKLLPDKKMWETRLSQEATLYSESGLPVWVDKAGKILDRSRNRRHDFYIYKRMKFPAALPLGRYLLKVTVEDKEAKRVAEQTMQVELAAQLETEQVAGEK